MWTVSVLARSRKYSIPHWTSLFFSFDTETKTWQPIKPMNVARYYASATIVNGSIYIAGGRNDLSSLTDTVEVYNPNGDQWMTYTPMNKIRNAFALIKAGEFLYALGSHSSIERYDPWNSCWTVVRTYIIQCRLILQYIELNDFRWSLSMSVLLLRAQLKSMDYSLQSWKTEKSVKLNSTRTAIVHFIFCVKWSMREKTCDDITWPEIELSRIQTDVCSAYVDFDWLFRSKMGQWNTDRVNVFIQF